MDKIRKFLQSILLKLYDLLDTPEEKREKEYEKEKIMGWFHN